MPRPIGPTLVIVVPLEGPVETFMAPADRSQGDLERLGAWIRNDPELSKHVPALIRLARKHRCRRRPVDHQP